MKTTRLLVGVLALALMITIPALANDQQKAQSELNKVTALARDLTGRTVVNLSMSQALSVPRMTLVQERRDTGLNYGSLFLASQLTKSGTTMEEIAAQLKAGKKISEIASDRHADWKAIAEATKKLNSSIDTNLYNYFIKEKNPTKPAVAELYDVHFDGVKADAEDVNDKEIEAAGNRYQAMKESAAKAKGSNKGLGLADERIGYSDHTGGPGVTGAGGGASGGSGGVTNSGTTAGGFGGPQ